MTEGEAKAPFRRASALFFVQVALYSALVYAVRLRWPDGGHLGPLKWNGSAADFVQMWSVGLAGLVTELATKRSLRDIGLNALGAKYLLVAAAVPLAYCAAIYVPCWLLQVAVFRGVPSLLHGVAASFVHAPLRIVAALGEEIGWRGSATPNLAKASSARAAGLVCGLAWAVWHYVDILFFGYNVGTPPLYATACFTVFVVGAALFLTWLRLASGSVWPPTLFHAAHNALINDIFQRSTLTDPRAALFTSEFGAGMAATGLVLGVVGWRVLRQD